MIVINKPAGIIMHPGAGNYDKTIVGDTTKFWIKAQEKINQDKKLKLFNPLHQIFLIQI